jgi:hypothetical protein
MSEWVTGILDSIQCLFKELAEGVSDPFVLTIIATFVSAFAGTLGASFISERNQRRESQIREIRNTNAAITASFSIANTCLSLKKQHVRELKEKFDNTRNEAIAHREGLKNGSIEATRVFDFEADMQSLPPLTFPIRALEKQVFEKISGNTRTLALVNSLNGALESLNSSILQRNHLAQQFKVARFPSEAEKAAWYFGFRNAKGHLDRTYPDTVQAIYSLLDDCIFFSSRLCGELEKHGNNIKKKGKKKLPVVNQVKFDVAQDLNLMPNEEPYQDWLSAFQSPEKP